MNRRRLIARAEPVVELRGPSAAATGTRLEAGQSCQATGTRGSGV